MTFLWILAALVTLVFVRVVVRRWPTPKLRFCRNLGAAQRAIACREWDAFELQMTRAAAESKKISRESIRDWSVAELELTQAQGCYWQGLLDQVSPHLAAAIENFEKVGGPDRVIRLSMAYNFWGDTYFDMGDLDKAADQFRLAAQILGSAGNAPMGIFSLQRLGDVLLEKGDYTAAREVIERCVEMERKILHSNNPNPGANPAISMTMPDLTLACRDFPRAEALFREKVNYWSRMATRPDNVDVTRYQFHLATAQREQGHLQDAATTLQNAFETAEREFGPQHPRVARARRKLEEIKQSIDQQTQPSQNSEAATA